MVAASFSLAGYELLQ